MSLFNLFKKKPILKTLLPSQFVDIHSHLLFGIDDGAKNIDDTKYLLSKMEEMGYTKWITTPHIKQFVFENTPKIIDDKLKEVQKEVPNYDITAGAEYMIDDLFFENVQKEPLLPLKDNYVLVEMSYLNPPIRLKEIIFEIQLKGYQPVLAHPERYGFYHNDIKKYQVLKDLGCLFQLNLLSTVGYYGSEVREAADVLLKNNWIDFTGSDVHHAKHIAAFDQKVQIKSINQLQIAMMHTRAVFS